jgi:hypothetical protein
MTEDLGEEEVACVEDDVYKEPISGGGEEVSAVETEEAERE